MSNKINISNSILLCAIITPQNQIRKSTTFYHIGMVCRMINIEYCIIFVVKFVIIMRIYFAQIIMTIDILSFKLQVIKFA